MTNNNSYNQETYQTHRPTVTALEAILFQPIKILDHGFVRVIDYMGDDNAIVQAARVSYGNGTKQTSDDRALIYYLMRHSHTTPFEMATIKLHIKLPIFIARQWMRHRMASINEYSARYSIMDREFYIPNHENLAAQSISNKQGREEILEGSEATNVLEILTEDAIRNYDHYSWMLNETKEANRKGLARELARMNLTLNTYTQFYWQINLHNLFHFLKLRADHHAQYEIRVYAEEILKIVEKWMPISYQAFREYRLEACNLSKTAIETIKKRLKGESVTFQSSGLSKREWNELDKYFDMRGLND